MSWMIALADIAVIEKYNEQSWKTAQIIQYKSVQYKINKVNRCREIYVWINSDVY